MPPEFIDGMVKRAHILSDVGLSALEHWDPLWQRAAADPDAMVHLWISMNAQMQPDGTPVPELEEETAWLRDRVAHSAGAVRLLSGNGTNEADFQQAGALMIDAGDGTKRPSPKEHFGFTDGIGDPVFDGQFEPEVEARRMIGRGKLMPDQTWQPIATGEFLLGHVDESQELPPAAPPAEFVRNGSFMAYRKLHEYVAEFWDYIDRQSALYAKIMGVPPEEANQTIRAKMVGRWANGVPLMAAPTYQDMQRFEQQWADAPALMAKAGNRTATETARLEQFKQTLIDFKYRDDLDGFKCPVAAHIRRGNSRDMLDPKVRSPRPCDWEGSVLNNRRRILRRGLPYGSFAPSAAGDDQEHGVIFIAVCASLSRQFEFILQQWINYGMDFNVGNDTCPLLGDHQGGAKFVIQSDPASGRSPFIMDELPQFVTSRGGEYFFLPSITALRMIASGIVDPT